MRFVQKLIKTMASYYTRRRILVKGVSCLLLAILFAFGSGNSTLSMFFAVVALIYLGFYTYYAIHKEPSQ